MNQQRAYWDRVAAHKTFTHPLHDRWLAECVGPQSRILDYGCGYGRTLDALAQRGFRNTLGVDFSQPMIERGRRTFPQLDLRAIDELPIAEADASFDLVILFAVLTCIPADDDQVQVIAELHRLLRPGSVLYISDMPLQSDGRNQARYAAGMARFGTWGAFETDDGAIMRHHPLSHFDSLLADFEQLAAGPIPLTTMNGRAAVGLQILARRPAGR
jgi:SAM-dependent methyltransferase